MSYKILIVDDEPMLTALLCDHLGDNGYITFAANSAEDAVSLPEKAPDLILLDINMPVMNGLELCKSIRGHVSLVSSTDTLSQEKDEKYAKADYFLKNGEYSEP